MRQHRWVLEVAGALLVLMFACMLVWSFVESVHQEDVCWAAGYQTPIMYEGECYCFGRNGEPEVVALAVLEANGHD